jgi:hypothetical protein
VAGTHGDEVTGVAAIHRLLDLLQDAGLIAGTLHLMPVLNPAGAELTQRHVPLDGADLNRSFPGSPTGTPTERLAHLIYTAIAATRPNLVIDLHTFSGPALPFALLDRLVEAPEAELSARVLKLAEIFGVTPVYDLPADHYRAYRLDRSLTGALLNRARIPAFVVELGPGRVVHPAYADAGALGLVNVLRHMGLLPAGAPVMHATRIDTPTALRRDPEVTAGCTGIVTFLVAPGDRVSPGQPVATVRRLTGEVLETVEAPRGGWVLALGARAAVVPGASLMTLAVPDEG